MWGCRGKSRLLTCSLNKMLNHMQPPRLPSLNAYFLSSFTPPIVHEIPGRFDQVRFFSLRSRPSLTSAIRPRRLGSIPIRTRLDERFRKARWRQRDHRPASPMVCSRRRLVDRSLLSGRVRKPVFEILDGRSGRSAGCRSWRGREKVESGFGGRVGERETA